MVKGNILSILKSFCSKAKIIEVNFNHKRTEPTRSRATPSKRAHVAAVQVVVHCVHHTPLHLHACKIAHHEVACPFPKEFNVALSSLPISLSFPLINAPPLISATGKARLRPHMVIPAKDRSSRVRAAADALPFLPSWLPSPSLLFRRSLGPNTV